jgi:hypothetical protein
MKRGALLGMHAQSATISAGRIRIIPNCVIIFVGAHPPHGEVENEWHSVPRGHLSGYKARRVGADHDLLQDREFVHTFTSAYSVTTSSLDSTAVQG